MSKIYFLNKPVLDVDNKELEYLLNKKIVVRKNGYIYLNPENDEIHYLFSPNIKPFKKILYLEYINSKHFTCEDCGKPFSFHIRPVIEADGTTNFKKIVCVCKECRTKLLNKQDILVPQFKKHINWRLERERIRQEIKDKNIQDDYKYYKLSCNILRLEKFTKLVLPPIPSSSRSPLIQEYYSKYKLLIEELLGADIDLDKYENRKIIRDYLFTECDGVCPVCGKKFHKNDLTIDHIIAKDLGGINEISNFIGMCGGCNTIKSNMTILEFLCSMELDRMPYRILIEAYSQQIEMKKLLQEYINELKNTK